MTTPFSLASEDPEKQIRLDRMKRRATALLILSVAIFVAAWILERTYPWVGYLRATAEAAIVGGLADWFAVTALFRHPLGIPIPHTAIIPRRKDHIARALGNFVQRNFMAPELIAGRLKPLRLAERLARWLTVPAQADRLSRTLAHGLAGAARVIRDDDVQSLIDRALVARVRKIHVAPMLGGILALLTANRRHQELLDEALQWVAAMVKENEPAIRERVRAESPWWIPGPVDDKLHDKIVTGVARTVEEVGQDPQHPLRLRFDAAVEAFIKRVETSPEVAARLEAIKEEMLAHPAVREFSAQLWSEAKQALIAFAERQDAASGVQSISSGLQSAGRALLANPALIEKVDQWLTDTILSLVEQYRGDVGQFISDTVIAWDSDATSRKIELQIGRDLQFVRINGTVVGGLVGLLIYSVARWLG